MSWSSFAALSVLHGVLVASASGSIGLNYRKNGVFNVGLAGISFLGVLLTFSIVEFAKVSLYWGIPVCIIVGALLNIGLNYLYLSIRKRYSSNQLVLGSTVLVCLVLLFGGNLVFEAISTTRLSDLVSASRASEFTLFTIPGIYLIGFSVLIFNVFLNFILSPVVDDRKSNPFDKWDLLFYALSGSTSCLVGMFYPMWSISRSLLVPIIIAGALIGGMDKNINPFLGGFVSGVLWTFAPLTAFLFGPSAFAYSYWIPILLGLVSIRLFPLGIVGWFRKVVEYKY
jgi:hypothetical protein